MTKGSRKAKEGSEPVDHSLGATYLTKMSRVSQHVDVEELCHIPASVGVVFLAKRVSDLCTFLVDDCSLIGCCTRGPDLPNEIS